MPRQYMSLRLTDGTTSIGISVAPNDTYPAYMPEGGWMPAVASDNEGTLRTSPFAPVTETLDISIQGTSYSEVHVTLRALVTLIKQGRAWDRGSNVPMVWLEHGVQGSSLAGPQYMIVIGGNDGEIASLPASYNDRLHLWMIDGITLQLTRRGLRYLADSTATGYAENLLRYSSFEWWDSSSGLPMH